MAHGTVTAYTETSHIFKFHFLSIPIPFTGKSVLFSKFRRPLVVETDRVFSRSINETYGELQGCQVFDVDAFWKGLPYSKPKSQKA